MNNIGPGVIPYIIKDPIKIAVTESPGIPNDSIVVIAPPITALFAVQVTESPSTEPSPYSSGCLLVRFACPQQIMEAISPPAPGIAPIITEIADAKRFFGNNFPNNLNEGICFLVLTSAFIVGVSRSVV